MLCKPNEIEQSLAILATLKLKYIVNWYIVNKLSDYTGIVISTLNNKIKTNIRMKCTEWCGKNWFLFSFKLEKKCILSKKYLSTRNCCNIERYFEYLTMFCTTCVYGMSSYLKKNEGEDTWKMFSFVHLLWLLNHKTVGGTKTNWKFWKFSLH